MMVSDGNGKLVDVTNNPKFRNMAESILGFNPSDYDDSWEDDEDGDCECDCGCGCGRDKLNMRDVAPSKFNLLSNQEMGEWYKVNKPIIDHAKMVYDRYTTYSPITGKDFANLYGKMVSPVGSPSIFTVNGVDVESGYVYLSNGSRVSASDLLVNFVDENGNPLGKLKNSGTAKKSNTKKSSGTDNDTTKSADK